MTPLFSKARKVPKERKRIVFAEGEEERMLRAAQIVVDENLAMPILIGRPAVIEQRIARCGLRIRSGVDFSIVNPEFDERYRDYWQTYHRMMARCGVSPKFARLEVRRRSTLIGALLIHKNEADGMICGTISATNNHLVYIDRVIGHRKKHKVYGAMNALVVPGRQLFIADTHVNIDPSAAELAEIALMAAEEIRRFGIVPKVALLSHSNFGTSDAPSAVKMRETLAILREAAPDLEVDGEMHADSALDETIRKSFLSDSTLHGSANLLIMPNMDAANIAYNLLKVIAGNGIAIGPILLGAAAPIHILTPATTVRRIVNMAVLTVVEAASASD